MFLITYYKPDYGLGFLPERLDPEDFLAGDYFQSLHKAQVQIRYYLKALQDYSPKVRIQIGDGRPSKNGVPAGVGPEYAFRFTDMPSALGGGGPYIIYDLDAMR